MNALNFLLTKQKGAIKRVVIEGQRNDVTDFYFENEKHFSIVWLLKTPMI
jgi:hypothetical protein